MTNNNRSRQLFEEAIKDLGSLNAQKQSDIKITTAQSLEDKENEKTPSNATSAGERRGEPNDSEIRGEIKDLELKLERKISQIYQFAIGILVTLIGTLFLYLQSIKTDIKETDDKLITTHMNGINRELELYRSALQQLDEKVDVYLISSSAKRGPRGTK